MTALVYYYVALYVLPHISYVSCRVFPGRALHRTRRRDPACEIHVCPRVIGVSLCPYAVYLSPCLHIKHYSLSLVVCDAFYRKHDYDYEGKRPERRTA